jgi:hypothetical protein
MFSEVRFRGEEWLFSAVFGARYASPHRKFESHSLRHLVNLLRELSFLSQNFGRKSPLLLAIGDSGETGFAAESAFN